MLLILQYNSPLLLYYVNFRIVRLRMLRMGSVYIHYITAEPVAQSSKGNVLGYGDHESGRRQVLRYCFM